MADNNYTPPKMPWRFPLYKGMKNPLVTELQGWLDDIADWYPIFAEKPKHVLDMSGEFDEKTETYLKAFQKFCGLPQSGVYTMETHGYMEWKYDNCFQIEARRLKREQDAAAAKAEEAKKKKAQKWVPKIPTKTSADPFATRKWTK